MATCRYDVRPPGVVDTMHRPRRWASLPGERHPDKTESRILFIAMASINKAFSRFRENLMMSVDIGAVTLGAIRLFVNQSLKGRGRTCPSCWENWQRCCY
jgi:hypothetical protein